MDLSARTVVPRGGGAAQLTAFEPSAPFGRLLRMSALPRERHMSVVFARARASRPYSTDINY